MKKMMRLIPVLLILYALYIVLLSFVDGGFTLDGAGKVRLEYDTRTISLPSYLRFAELSNTKDGTGADGDSYTNFMYILPDLFASAEMYVIVNWTEETSAIHICESRGMEFMLGDYTDVTWKTPR